MKSLAKFLEKIKKEGGNIGDKKMTKLRLCCYNVLDEISNCNNSCGDVVITEEELEKYTKIMKVIKYNNEKAIVLKHYEECGENYPSDVAYVLNMDLKLTIKIVNELVEEGKFI